MLDNLTRRVSGIFSRLRGKGRLSEADVQEMLREVRTALLEADVNFQVAKEFVQQVKEKAIGEDLYGSLNADQTMIKIVRDELVELLGGAETRFNWSPSPPTVILMAGLQGSGKTTTTAKLARYLQQREKKKVMLAACDIARPAAVKQLEVLGEQIDVPVFSLLDGTSPPQIAKAALERCKYLMLDVLIIDTAGRLTTDDALMEELAQIRAVTNSTESLLVLDATTGQEAVTVAQSFHERLALTGVVFTKLDGDTRGGAMLSVKKVTGVPIRFIGVGEQVDMLEAFYPARMAERILGFGDILSIVEQAEQVIDQKQAEAMAQSMQSGTIDFNMMLQQFRMLKNMGPLKGLLKRIPGVQSMVPEEALDQVNEKDMGRIEAIILSMTPKERSNPDIINGSRRKRIAVGSGTSVEEVNRMINNLYDMRKMMKQAHKLQQRQGKFKRRR